MRQIKFRVWDKETKQMCIVQYITLDFERCQIWNGKDEEEVYSRKFDEVEIMQFTGLLDKNGKEIYQGDLLALNGVGDVVEVKWDEDEQGWRPKVLKGDTAWEVVGNIYENSELLQ